MKNKKDGLEYERTIQIDVKGVVRFEDVEKLKNDIIRCDIHIDGRCCEFWTSKRTYEALQYDGIFIRDGKTIDSSGAINTSITFTEKYYDKN